MNYMLDMYTAVYVYVCEFMRAGKRTPKKLRMLCILYTIRYFIFEILRISLYINIYTLNYNTCNASENCRK